MKTVIKRSILNYLKNPILWIGLIIMIASTYQCLSSYFTIRYISSDEQIPQKEISAVDADITEGYVPTTDEERRYLWENHIKQNLMDSKKEAENIIEEIQNMDVTKAAEYLKSNYGYYGAEYAYEDFVIRRGTAEEINSYIQDKLSGHSFSYYFAKKFTDFAGLHMVFFATILLAFLFIQDTRKNTYELLHTKPFTAVGYVCGKVAGGFVTMAGMLVILDMVFFGLCANTAVKSGFSVNLMDFLMDSLLYIVPNMLMICCVYTMVALAFKNPLPATPLLLLHIVYSNMLTFKGGVYQMRPLSIMVRFPGRFFETQVPELSNLNQIFLVVASIILLFLSVTIWKRRRFY